MTELNTFEEGRVNPQLFEGFIGGVRKPQWKPQTGVAGVSTHCSAQLPYKVRTDFRHLYGS